MKSLVLPSFWEAYRSLDPSLRPRVRKAYELWLTRDQWNRMILEDLPPQH